MRNIRVIEHISLDGVIQAPGGRNESGDDHAPVLLGRGKRFFADTADPRELALVSTKIVSSHVLVNTYRHVGALRTESAT